MLFRTCPKCGAKLEIDECDTTPGCREMEEAFCPECGELAAKVFTSGIPQVRVTERPTRSAIKE